MNNFDSILNTKGKALNMSKSGLKGIIKKPKSRFKKALKKYLLISIVGYILAAIIYFTIFLISLL